MENITNRATVQIETCDGTMVFKSNNISVAVVKPQRCCCCL